MTDTPPHVAAGRQPASTTGRAPLALLFFASLMLYLFTAGSNFSSGDAYAELRVTQSLVEHRWFDEQPSPKCLPGSGYGEPGRDGRCYASHGIGYSLLLVPGYLLARAAIGVFGLPHCDTWTYCVPMHLVSWTSCLLTALTVALLAQVCQDLGYGPRRAAGVALVYGFASLAWPYARYGFDVTPTALFLLAAVREALQADTTQPGDAQVARWLRAGCFAAVTLLIRLPTLAALLPLAVACLLAQRARPRRPAIASLIAFAAPLAAALLWTAWFNQVRFASPLDDGHAHNAADALTSTPWLGIVGMLLSPGKGLVWYCPASLVAVAAVPAFYRRHRRACVLCLSVAAASAVPYVLVNDWYGGDAWGPRFLLPVLPLLLIPLVELPSIVAGRPLRALLAALLIALGAALTLAGQLVPYAERLRLAAKAGVGERLFWEPRYSPLRDHLATLWAYIRHPGDALRTTATGAQSIDIWWLNLWRNDLVPPLPVALAAAAMLLLTAFAALRLVRALRE